MIPRSNLLDTAANRPREVHSFVLGVHLGLAGEGDRVIDLAFGSEEPASTAGREIRKEPWYASGGALAGRTVAALSD